MPGQCEKCKRVIIPVLKRAAASSITAAILCCAEYDRDHHCPYLPDHQHTPREVTIPPQFSNTSTVVASSGEYWDHESIVNRYGDPEIDGNINYVVTLEKS